MAKSTCNPNVDVPKGMQTFTVIRSTIRDSLGQYCEPGDKAVLDKKTAQAYLDLNFIKVDLPDFDDESFDNDKDTSTGKADTKSEPSTRDDGDTKGAAKQATPTPDAGALSGQNRRRTSPKSE